MDHEMDKIFLDSGEKTYSVFADFMMRTAKFEELVHIGHQFLSGFCQEFQTFKRPQLYKTSDVVDNIIEANHTDRMKTYVEAGCRHHHLDIQNISKLHSSRQGLQDYLIKAKVLLDELECLKEGAVAIAKSANERALEYLEKQGDGMRHQGVFHEEEDVVERMCVEDKSTLHATLMASIFSMMRLDYTMQENIVRSISLTNTSSELESYCFMWDLRPYVDDNVIHQGWKLVQ